MSSIRNGRSGGAPAARTHLIRPAVRRALALAGVYVLAACSGGGDGGGSPTDPGGGGSGPAAKADVQGTLTAFPAWSKVAPPVEPTTNDKVGDATGERVVLTSESPDFSPNHFCTETPYSLAKNPEKIVTMSPDVGLLVPGVLLQGHSHVLGSLQQLRITERAPIDLVINEPGVGNPTETVQAPTLGTLQTGVNRLIQDAETSGFPYGSDVVFRQVTSYTTDQATLGLGISVRYLTSTARSRMSSKTSAERTTVTASFVQDAFSIRADGPAAAADWFSDDLTQDRWKSYLAAGQIGPDNPPLYVLEVTYGRIVTVNFTSTASKEDIEAMFNASVNGGVGSMDTKLTASQKKMVREAEIQVVSLGGPAEGGFQFAKEILSPDDPTTIGLDGFFAQDVALTTFVPISYTIADLRTGQVAKVGEITDYEQLECASSIVSDFEDGNQGWTATDQINTNYPQAVTGAIVRNGERALLSAEGTSALSYFRAPPRYLGGKSAFSGATVSYWTAWMQGICPNSLNIPLPCTAGYPGSPMSGAAWPDMRIWSARTGKVLVFAAEQEDIDPGTWALRSFVLAPSPELRVYDPSLGQAITDALPATQADIDEVLSDISRWEVRAELRGGYRDNVLLDNFTVGSS